MDAAVAGSGARVSVPLVGRLMYHLLPIRRGVMLANLRRVFSDTLTDKEIIRIAQAHYAHGVRLVFEYLRFPFLSAQRRSAMVRVENEDAILRAAMQGKGVLVLTGHFGLWEVATLAGMAKFPQLHGRFHVTRRRLWPRWFNRWVTTRSQRHGLHIIPKQGAVDRILERLAAAEIVLFIYDQHAGGRSGVEGLLFGHPAWTFKTLALAALTTGAAVVPASSWRESDGTNVIRFEEALPLLECNDLDEAVRANTRLYNHAFEQLVLRHPEQWGMWMHRMWKGPPGTVKKPFIRWAAERFAARVGWLES